MERRRSSVDANAVDEAKGQETEKTRRLSSVPNNLSPEERAQLDQAMTMASIKHHTKTEDTGISKVGRRRSNPGKRGPPPSPGVSRGVVGQGGGGVTKDDGGAVGADESRDYYDGSADSKETHGNEDGGHDQSQEGKEDGEEESEEPQPRRIMEVVKSAGLVFSEKGEHQFVLSKPKIMPIKSREMEKLEAKLAEEMEDNE
ncbi:hypothetical protein TrST_g9920 [Triparma strigata]|uniref:Uncharacterized protein n=1 Tax=Triparma strigata TaxID=1606541 RepID=A0A9W7A5J1_9STRA|nr:hypothetical protein TrST_g9920 [Triparma strigata]